MFMLLSSYLLDKHFTERKCFEKEKCIMANVYINHP